MYFIILLALIHWISIYTADSVIQSLNNQAKMDNEATQTIDPSDSLMRLVQILEDNQPAFYTKLGKHFKFIDNIIRV